MSSKTDESHRGIGFQKAEAMLSAHGDTPDDDPSPSETDGETLSVPSETTDESTDDGHRCPECKADAGDVSDLSDGDRVQCTECGEKLVWSED